MLYKNKTIFRDNNNLSPVYTKSNLKSFSYLKNSSTKLLAGASLFLLSMIGHSFAFENDTNVTYSEYLKTVSENFKKIDKNSDSKISLDEYENLEMNNFYITSGYINSPANINVIRNAEIDKSIKEARNSFEGAAKEFRARIKYLSEKEEKGEISKEEKRELEDVKKELKEGLAEFQEGMKELRNDKKEWVIKSKKLSEAEKKELKAELAEAKKELKEVGKEFGFLGNLFDLIDIDIDIEDESKIKVLHNINEDSDKKISDIEIYFDGKIYDFNGETEDVKKKLIEEKNKLKDKKSEKELNKLFDQAINEVEKELHRVENSEFETNSENVKVEIIIDGEDVFKGGKKKIKQFANKNIDHFSEVLSEVIGEVVYDVTEALVESDLAEVNVVNENNEIVKKGKVVINEDDKNIKIIVDGEPIMLDGSFSFDIVTNDGDSDEAKNNIHIKLAQPGGLAPFAPPYMSGLSMKPGDEFEILYKIYDFDRYDRNKNGSISRSEFLRVSKNRFKKFDENHNRKVSLTELDF